VPVELVARQLGHRDAVMALKVYGRFVPRAPEWDYWREKVREAQRENGGLLVPWMVPARKRKPARRLGKRS
jgi:hypothetical protein